MISLYFHVPFCTKKCPYCHFYIVPNRPLFHQIFQEGLEREWEQKLPLLSGKTIASIYFGGGTPSLFAPDGIEKILSWIKKSPASLAEDVEITLEANPENGDASFFKTLKEIGINRISFGVQSLHESSLRTLERTHSAKRAVEAIFLAKEAGIDNLSIDLMYDLPSQTLSSWEFTLKEIASLPIRHLSLYNLTIEPHTSFYKKRDSLTFPNSEESLRLLETAVLHLKKMGLERYEISAFSHPGYESKHNMGYWTSRPFLGFGPSAFSDWEQERFQNICHLLRYTKRLKEGLSPLSFREKLPYPQSLQERLAIHLRLLKGAPKEMFAPLPEEVQKSLKKLEEEGLLISDQTHFKMSEKGLLFYDLIAAEII